MGKIGTPYIKVEKRDGNCHVTVMKGVPGGHVLAGRGICPDGDTDALKAEVSRVMQVIRLREGPQEIQADGYS